MKLVSGGVATVWAVFGVIVVAAIFRLIPHPFNFTPIVAMALFGGAYVENKRLATFVVFGAMFLSDLMLGFHSTMLVVYPSLFCIILAGRILSNRRSALFGVAPILAPVTVASSIFFFLTTNFGVWLLQDLYPKTLSGLGLCYVAALPFFQNAIVGDLIYTGVLFGSIVLLERSSLRHGVNDACS